jgi:catechol 2,3-dioxygenase-like lactoylglutathione lyase family enzyme
MVAFRTPQVVLICPDLPAAASFYEAVGFTEVFRTPAEGPAIHVDLELDGYRLGLASEQSVRDDHGLDPVVEGQRVAVVLWTDDTVAAYDALQALGATPVHPPAPWLGRLLVAWVEDPAGHLVQVVQDTPSPAPGSTTRLTRSTGEDLPLPVSAGGVSPTLDGLAEGVRPRRRGAGRMPCRPRDRRAPRGPGRA